MAVAGVRAGALQPGLDVIHPILNYQGLGIVDGNFTGYARSHFICFRIGHRNLRYEVFSGADI